MTIARPLLTSALCLLPFAVRAALPLAAQRPTAAQAARIVLVGDSTVTDDSGWGLGFKQFVTDAADVRNTAANGRSSKSFIDEGRWKAALAEHGRSFGLYYLIQFGHNDEPGKGPARETDPATTYTANMRRYIQDVRAQGGAPVLVTSLARRIFDPATGKIRSSQTAYVDAVRRLAAAELVPLVDLFARSVELSEKLGAKALEEYSPRQPDGTIDTTHLNAKGSVVFARLVVDELRRAVPQLAPVLRAEPRTADAVRVQRSVDAIVATDGTGQYTSVQDAINAAPQNTSTRSRWIILVKPGTYRELVYVQREKHHVSLVGEDPAGTVITHSLKASDVGLDGKPIGTFRTPTVVIDADDFTIENLTIENAAGPVGQALALRVDGDRLTVRNSRFLGWQDTIFLNRGRHYFEDSYIAGHVDFIFGGATAFFERCHLHAWRDGYLTAASTPVDQPFGFVFTNGIITGEPEVRAYLGRPWRDFAHVAFVNTIMGEVVRPAGWHNWDRPEREKTTRYFEIGTTGAGGSVSARAAWAHVPTREQAAQLTVEKVLAGSDGWDPRLVAPYPAASRANAAPLPRPPGPAAAASGQSTPAAITWDQVLRQPPAWFGTAEAVRIGDNVRLYQRKTGGWPKNVDMARPLSDADRTRLAAEQPQTDSTIDNGATTRQIEFLARVAAATNEERFRSATLAGVDYLLAAQYPNGGWPQYFPLRTDYSRHITFNDDAMVAVVTLLQGVALERPPFERIDPARRRAAVQAIERAHRVILATQIRVKGQLTGWCQQHDAVTLAPASARTYEHPSISGRETVTLVRYLMSIEKPAREIIAAIEAAVAWLRQVEIHGWRTERRPDPSGPGGYDVVMIEDPAAPPLWARFYDIGTNRPIYSGRDGVIKYKMAEIEIERRTGYSWVGPYAQSLLADEFPKWKARVGRR